MAETLPSIFDTRDGDQVQALYAVPGAPVLVEMHEIEGKRACCCPPFGRCEGFSVVDVNDAEVQPITDELRAEFYTRQKTAESMHQIGHRIRARYL